MAHIVPRQSAETAAAVLIATQAYLPAALIAF